MKSQLVFLIAFSCPLFVYSQDLEIAGKAKIGMMDKVNTADSVVVRLADGTLALRDVSSLAEMQILSISNDTIFLSDNQFIELPEDSNAGWTMNVDSTSTLKYVGIGTSSPDQILHVQGNAKITGRLEIDNGNQNMFIGLNAGLVNTSGSENMFFGKDAGVFNTQGSFNLFMGANAGRLNQIGTGNIYIGKSAGQQNIMGSDNNFIGRESGVNTVGDKNTFLGSFTGYNATGSNNVFLGYNAGRNETGSDKLYIENSDSNTPLIYGEFDNDLVRVNGKLEIGTTAEPTQLDVTGTVRIGMINNNNTSDSILVSDGNGLIQYRDASTLSSEMTHAIGDLAHGGIVFFVNATGTHGLVAANMDQYSDENWYEAHDELSNPSRHDVEGAKYFDWRLPSKWELNEMWENLNRNGCTLDSSPCTTSLGSFSDNNYWSSTETSNFDGAWSQSFDVGPQGSASKGLSDGFYVRSVRAF